MENSQSTPGFGAFSMQSTVAGNTFGSGSVLFGSSTSTPQTQSQNLFSQGPGSVPVFGSAARSSTFSTSGSETGLLSSAPRNAQQASTQSSLFGNVAASPPTGSLFGVTSSSSTSPFGVPSSSSTSLFGVTPSSSTSPFGVAASSSSASPFGVASPSLTSPFSVTPSSSTSPFGVAASSSNTLFGNKVTSAPSSGTLFGKSLNTSLASLDPVFGTFGKKDETSNFGLFKGATSQATSSDKHQQSTSAQSGMMVFGSQSKLENAISTSFSTIPNQPSLLFGKFQSPTSSSVSPSFQAGKEKTSSVLFGKPVSQTPPSSTPLTQTSSSLFSTDQSGKTLRQQQQQGGSPFSSEDKPTGLFGKPLNVPSETGFSGTGSSKDDVGAEEDNTAEDDKGDFDSEASPKKSIGRWKSRIAKPAVRRPSLLTASRSTSNVLSDDAEPSQSLVVRNIPPQHLDKEILRKHFSQFGVIRLLRVTPDKSTAAITFDAKESAMKAKTATNIDDESPPMDIFYRVSPAKKTILKILRDPQKKTVSQGAADELKSLAEIPEFETEPAGFSKAPSQKPLRTSVSRHRSPTPPRRSSPTPHSSISVPQDNADLPPDVDTIKGLLKTLYQARALETSEKISILDKRDQLLKLLRGRQHSDLASAKAFEGTCPDMCPEKERYYREDTRRLALYEVILSTMSNVVGQKTKVDHAKAVKEYSRSSADQKEPFPHELRPLSVLHSTMVYMLRHVADEGGEGRWSEWYDFFWNRTRGIRKDITQQQLCHVEVAHLIEQCVRFHIFCSERLCEEDMMTFDAKINDENLTKCLQTLKELYTDLEIKFSCYCSNEAEMRAYIVLMNLNQGDTLREIQQFRPEIRDSPYIRFAVEAYNALNSSNYVRFFRLIKKTTFLNGCILHRYFNQIRRKALHIIKRALTTQGKSVSYPTSEMMRLLCFENVQEVVEFSSHYGLRVDNSAIMLDGTSYFVEPEGSLPQRRSIDLIEKKRAVSVGETIFGGPLPALDLPPPSSSFDADGHFIFSQEFQQSLAASGIRIPSQIGEVLSRGTIVAEQAAPSPPPPPPPPPPAAAVPESPRLPLARDVVRMPYSNEAIKSVARALILEETDSQAGVIANEVLKWEEERQACIRDVSREIVESALTKEIKSVAVEVVDEEEQELRHALEVATQKQQCMERIRDTMVEEVLGAMVKDVTTEEWKLVEEERHRRSVLKCAQACTDNVVDQVVREQINDVASEVHQVDVVAKRERLAVTEAQILLSRTRKFFQFWHKSYLKRLRVKRAMQDFPVAPPSCSQSARLSSLVPSRPTDRITDNSFYVSDRAKLTVNSPMDIFYNNFHLSASLSMASAQQMLSGIRMWQSLDIGSTVSRQLSDLLLEWKDCNVVEKDTSYIQWKLVLSTSNQKSDEETDFVPWIKTKLSQEKSENRRSKPPSADEGEILSKYTTHLMPSQSQAISLSFCVRSFHGNWNDNQATNVVKKNVLKGMSGLIFITSDADKFMSSETHWRKDCLRLQQLLTKKPKYPAVPVVIIIPRLTPDISVSRDLLSERLDLTSLHQKGFLSAVHFAQPYVALDQWTVDSCSELATQLCNCLRFLASRIPSPPSLGVKSLADFVEDSVVEIFKAPVYHDLRTRTRHQLLHQSPNTLLSLYNDIIDHLGMVIASDTLTTCSWPAPEFDQQSKGLKSEWNSEQHLCDLYELMTKLRLPPFRYSDMENDGWALACQDVWKYLDAVTKKDSGSAKICLYQKVIDLLHTTKKRFDQFCWLASEDGNCEPTYVNMAWTDLIDACIHYKMVSLRTGHLSLRKHEDEKEENDEPEDDDFEEIIVYYDQSELEDYETPSSWEGALRDTETIASVQVKETVTVVKRPGMKRHLEETEPCDETVVKRKRPGTESQNKSERTMQSTDTADPALKNLSESYHEMLDCEKEASERYEKYLASILENSTLDLPTNLSFHSQHEENRRNDSLTDGTPKSSRSYSTVAARPDLKRRKLSEMISGVAEISSQAMFDKGIKEIKGLTKRTITDENQSPKNDLGEGDTISKRLIALKEEVEREKNLDTLFEMKLKKWMADI